MVKRLRFTPVDEFFVEYRHLMRRRGGTCLRATGVHGPDRA
jgi:hypothetical protein